MIKRTITTEISLSPRELEHELWEMTTEQKAEFLIYLAKRYAEQQCLCDCILTNVHNELHRVPMTLMSRVRIEDFALNLLVCVKAPEDEEKEGESNE